MARSPATNPSDASHVMLRISRALGRNTVPLSVPAPPEVNESIARLVSPDGDLTAKFVIAATAARMLVRIISRKVLAESVVGLLRQREAARVIVTRSGILADIDLVPQLRVAGIDAGWWSESSLDALYEVDAGVTDAWMGVAETGSVVIRSSPEHGRAVSLVPPLHVAVMEQSQIVPDLIDAMRRLEAEPVVAGAVFITGPSKTSDIEMTLVTGVHGPVEVVVFVVSSE